MAIIITGRLFHNFGKVFYNSGFGNAGPNPGNGGDTGGNTGGSTGGGGTIDLTKDSYGTSTPYQSAGTTNTKFASGTNATSQQGTDSSGNSTTVYTPGDYTPAEGIPAKNYGFANWGLPPAAKFWRINITAVQTPGWEPGVAYIVMFDPEGNNLIELGDDGLPVNGTPISSPGNFDTKWGFYNKPSAQSAMTSGWKSTRNDIGWIGYEFNEPVVVTRFCYEAFAREGFRSPKNFTIEYSQDGENWTVVNTVVGELQATDTRWRTIVTDASTLPHQNLQGSPAAYPMPSGMLAAYALRVIVPGYTGPLISVETDLFGTVQVYPDANGDLDVPFLQTIMNSNGTIGVSKWWDQSGNGQTAIVLDVAACPLIIEGGIPATAVNDRPSLHMHPQAPFNLPFGPLQNGGSTIQAIINDVSPGNCLFSQQMTSDQGATIGYRGDGTQTLSRDSEADIATGYIETLGAATILSVVWSQSQSDNSVTAGFSNNGAAVAPVSLGRFSGTANTHGRMGQNWTSRGGIGGCGVSNGYMSEVLFYPVSGKDTVGSLTALSNYFGIPLVGNSPGTLTTSTQPSSPPPGGPVMDLPASS